MKICPSCESENPEEAKFCGKCGAKVEASKKSFIPIVIASFILVIILVIGFNKLKTNPTTSDTDSSIPVITACSFSEKIPVKKYFDEQDKLLNKLLENIDKRGENPVSEEVIVTAQNLLKDAEAHKIYPCGMGLQLHYKVYLTTLNEWVNSINDSDSLTIEKLEASMNNARNNFLNYRHKKIGTGR
jgi:hypothetical protein